MACGLGVVNPLMIFKRYQILPEKARKNAVFSDIITWLISSQIHMHTLRQGMSGS